MGLNSQTDQKKSIAYTVPNDAPELNGGRAEISTSLVEKADVWGWGMLLWCVMIDGNLLEDNGKNYYWDHESDLSHNAQQSKIDEKRMSELKDTDGLSSVASRSCAAYLRRTHVPAEMALARGISTILECTLVKDPSERPNISNLLQKLVDLHNSPSLAFPGGYTFKEMPEPKQTEEMPFFDVCFIVVSFSIISLIAILVHSALPNQRPACGTPTRAERLVTSNKSTK